MGEKIWEGNGKGTGITVKSTGAEGASIELNFVAELRGVGRLQGTDFRDIGTLVGQVRPNGIFTGSGQGLFVTKDGGTVFYKLCGMYRVEKGVQKGPNLLTFTTSSQKLSWMNGLVILSEIRLDSRTQEYTSEGREWA